jgi:hypothetical protein
LTSKRESTEKILDFLEPRVPEIPKPQRFRRKQHATVDEDIVPPPDIDEGLAKGSSKKIERNEDQPDGKIDPIVVPTKMGARPELRELAERLLKRGSKTKN